MLPEIGGDQRLPRHFQKVADGGKQREALRVVTNGVDLKCCSLQGMESQASEESNGIWTIVLNSPRGVAVWEMIDAFAKWYPEVLSDKGTHYTGIDWVLQTQSEIFSSSAVSLSWAVSHDPSFH